MAADIIIPLAILCGAVVLIVYSAMRVSSMESRKEEQREMFKYPAMDLRLNEDPCDTCFHEQECQGVDRENCERYKALKNIYSKG